MTASTTVKRTLREVAPSSGAVEVRQAWGGVQTEIEAILRELEGARTEHLPVLRSRLQTLLESARVAASDKAEDARVLARHGVEMGRAQALIAREATTSYVRAHPWRALAAVGAVGLLIGFLGRRH